VSEQEVSEQEVLARAVMVVLALMQAAQALSVLGTWLESSLAQVWVQC
jgi:hypothetical protein